VVDDFSPFAAIKRYIINSPSTNQLIMKQLLCTLNLLFFLSALTGQGPALREAIRHDQAVDQYGVSGEGVVVVMIDRGIDYRHPDFVDDEGKTRIAYIFDMVNATGADAPDNPYGVGTIITREEINASLQSGGAPLSMDRGGHGTATTGIMVGDGSGTPDRQFAGVAPDATIISIKLTQDPFPAFGDQPGQNAFFNASYIPIALEFAHDKITELGLPSVTLMNIGSIGGPTDGTSTVCRAIDDFVAQGHPFVCGVGDDGGADNYARGTIAQGETAEILVEKNEAGNLRFDLWYSEDDRFQVSIERPNGTTEGPFPAPVNAGSGINESLGDIQLYHRGANQVFFGATSDRREILIDMQGATGTYKVMLEATEIGADGLFQATLNPARSGNDNRFASYVVAGHSINDYSSATRAISPTDYVVTTAWTALDGRMFDVGNSQGVPGDLWVGSSAGPTHDGRRGTDFATPGERAIGAYSPDTYYANFTGNIVAGSNGLYGLQTAVSASAPVATGIIALMLELNPDLTPDELLNLLHQSCLTDSFTGTIPNPEWGFGKLDALLALQNTALTVSTPTAIRADDRISIFPNPFREKLTLQWANGMTIERVELINALGQVVWHTGRLPGNNYEYLPDGLGKGLYVLVLYPEMGTPRSVQVIKQ